ncbi:MAG TPA: hypothetical protein PKE49_04685 [Leptospiraceae bacterium]|nr:hypothetical protein [Leptospiraceae bacterium]HMW59859.1 hypothetical protein [Leptospiraceae bacterium]HMX55795.1 hypothetical protein [Leptospiraceae bacterium]HMY47513.1 hypothetical protein [Leptospiraceae bacterium]HNE23335.1 hypothetical protein [Leptospiraceae bacterium]
MMHHKRIEEDRTIKKEFARVPLSRGLHECIPSTRVFSRNYIA